MDQKQKKWMLVTGATVIGIALAVAIGGQFKKQSTGGGAFVPEGTECPPVILADLPPRAGTEPEKFIFRVTEPAETEDQGTKQEEGSDVVIKTGTGGSEAMKDSLPPQTDKKEQVLQESVPRVETPPEEVLHDPTRKPDGEVVEGTPEAVEHEEGTRPEEPVVPEGTPQAGDTSGGQIYIPGFGWVDNQGGGASGIIAGDMYENGNKIGDMD